LDNPALNGFSRSAPVPVPAWDLEGDDFFSKPRTNMDEEELEAAAEVETTTAAPPPPVAKPKRSRPPKPSTGRPRGRPRKYFPGID